MNRTDIYTLNGGLMTDAKNNKKYSVKKNNSFLYINPIYYIVNFFIWHQQFLFLVSVPLEGKESVCKAEVVPIFVQLLEDEDAEVRANVAGALMFTTITTQGKLSGLWWYDNSPYFPTVPSFFFFLQGNMQLFILELFQNC